MKKIIFLMLVIFTVVVYADTPKSCKVLQEPNSMGFRFTDINKTIKACRQAIKDNPNEAQYWYELANAYDSKGNLEKAFSAYLKAASKGHTDAQYSLGYIYNYKKPYIDNKKAVHWYLKAAENNHDWAQIKLGSMYQEGKGVKKDISKALFWYKKASDLNNSSAQIHIGDMYYSGKDVEQNYTKAMNWYLKAAENNNTTWLGDADGDSNAQIKIADMYYYGIGIKKDYKQAFKWFMRAAKQGNNYAEYSIGYMYDNGEWATQNHKKAFTWYKKAAEKTFRIDAKLALGDMFLSGRGVKKSYKKAMQWYMKAAELDSVPAMRQIGFMYFKGWGVRKNNRKSFEWLKRAAMQGDVKSQIVTGSSYYEGNGVKKNYIKAYAWLNLALSSDLDESTRSTAMQTFRLLEIVMTPEQIALAQEHNPLEKTNQLDTNSKLNKNKSEKFFTGTGFFVNKSTVLTNHHVAQNCKRIELVRNGYKSTAKIKAKDSINDLAILKVDKSNNSSLSFRAGKGIRIGDDIIVIGYPLGELLGSGIKLTTGNVSALTGLINDTTSMQLTAPVQPGNSGGPLLDRSGNVVGVIVARLKKEQNVNLAIKANVAQMFLDINNIDYGVSMSKDKKDVADIADDTKDSIVQVICYQ